MLPKDDFYHDAKIREDFVLCIPVIIPCVFHYL